MAHLYVALLRGINVGGHRIEMPRLRGLFEELGFGDVSTFIASGNLIFTSSTSDEAALRTSIEAHLERALGYEVATFLRTPEELVMISAVGQDHENSGEPRMSHYVIFMHESSASLCAELSALGSPTDSFLSVGREIHWRRPGGLSDSPLFGKAFDRATRGVPMTTRNMNTVRRLVAKVGEQGRG